MRIALSSYSGIGAWLTLQLREEGHQVDYYLSKPEYAAALRGIIPAPFLPNGRGYSRYPDYSKYDLSIFDVTGREKQAEFSASMCPTIGDGAWQCAAEDDRNFGLQVMEECGIMVPPYEHFSDVGAAKSFIKKTGKRYVYKPDTVGGEEQDTADTYVSTSADDMLHYIDKVYAHSHSAPFVLQEVVIGTEVSTEGWFNGEDFYLINSTLEEKKFMNDQKGPNTGCSGNLVWSYGGCEPLLYKQGLGKMKKYLKSISYTGMLDLNTIVTTQGVYGLEWTPRFGYDAIATFMQLYAGNFGEMLHRIATGQVPEQSFRAEFAAGVRLSIPPYPSEIAGKHPGGIPIKGITEDDYLSTFMFDVECEKDEMITAGLSGFVAVPMGKGGTIGEAFSEVNDRIARIKIPQVQHRTDIEKFVTKRYNQLDRDGWLK